MDKHLHERKDSSAEGVVQFTMSIVMIYILNFLGIESPRQYAADQIALYCQTPVISHSLHHILFRGVSFSLLSSTTNL